MASRELKDAHPALQSQFTKAKKEFETLHPNVKVTLTATYRSKDEQNKLYAQGRTEKGSIVTNAKGGQSPHNYLPSFAIDVAFIIEGKANWTVKWFELFAKHISPTD